MAKPDQPDKSPKKKKNPLSINPDAAQDYLQRKKVKPNASHLTEGILKGNRVLLSQAITLIESENPDHQNIAQQIIENSLPYAGKSVRIGITGSPGVGKSTFIEAIGKHLTALDHQLAVLTIDPSSQLSKGSILGDKTRMPKLAVDPNAFIRPSPAGSSLGGVASKTRETIILCEAAGFDTIIVETVGVGQSEMTVHSMVDFFLLLLLPGAGDELQGIKRGIVEMADLMAVNKADGDRVEAAKLTKRQYQNALHLYPPKENDWTPSIVNCSALNNQGIDEIWKIIIDFHQQMKANSYFQKNRQKQSIQWFHESIEDLLKELFYQNSEMKAELAQIEKAILAGQRSPFRAARVLLESFLKRNMG
jgi:LAO/AO transport system kinase